jgi:DNA-binding transcriptional regulator WhiA
MAWFGNKKEAIRQSAENNSIKIVTQKNATKEVVDQAKLANQHLKDLLCHNGFTIQIFLAAGGITKTRTRKAAK